MERRSEQPGAAVKPQDFLIGIRDFFGILVPGSIILWLIPPSTGANLRIGSETAALFVFAILAYLIGALADKLGSLLDYLIDSFLRPGGFLFSFTHLAARAEIARRCRDLLLSGQSSPVTPDEHPSSIKSFWWDHLRLHCPVAKQELERIEAGQKLFRSLTAAFLFLAGYDVAAAPEWRPWPHAIFPDYVFGLVALSLISTVLYAHGRAAFLSAVYRFSLAYCIPASPDDARNAAVRS